MRTKSINPLAIIAAILVLVLAAVLVVWFFVANVVVNWHAYPKTAEFLNLRGKDISIEEYETLRRKLPNCEIYWSVPFQGDRYYENIPSLSVTSLTDEDVDVLDYFTSLDVIDAEGCTDYPQLEEVRNRHPETELRYSVTINGTQYPQNATEVMMTNVSDEEMELLRYLPALTKVDAGRCDEYGQLEKMQDMYPHIQVACTIKLCGEAFTSDTTEMTVTGITSAEAALLKHLPELTAAHLVEPKMSGAEVIALQSTYPNIRFTWEKDAYGKSYPNDAKEVEITGAKVNVADLDELVAYFPDMEQLFLNKCTVDNEAMAAYREEKRDAYKVVWTVDCGGITTRTDATYFMPIKEGVYYFFDEDTVNLRYCEDMICVDLGHMSIHNCEFAQYMPKLKYLILAHTQIKDITPLQHCKSLVFLELDWSIVRDYTPLLGCTALEDLNLGKTYADITPVLQMTWLKHLWFLDRSVEVQIKLTETFENTETELYLNGMFTAGGGWRNLPNYYAMRDVLGMPYMEM